MARTIRIGGASAAWGDTMHAARQLVEKGSLDYLVGDYLAEVTMALLARQRAKNPEAGHIPDWLEAIRPLLPEIRRQGIRLVTNAGGMNPRACRDAFLAAAEEAGLEFRVAVVTGDDLMPMAEAVRRSGTREMFTGAPPPERFASLNAYLGATPIAEALRMGADVVITGRVVDSALALGPLMHEFGWREDDYDLLAAGSLAGHVIECGAQATGGLFTDWEDVAEGWADMGFPVVECAPNGGFVVEKPAGTGGLVSPGTVAEQIVYEIGDPQAYRLPDVTCDFSQVRLRQAGPDRVLVSGARGREPGGFYKVCGTHLDGYRLTTTYMIAGGDAAARGRRSGEALVARAERLAAEAGIGPFREVSIEAIGSGETYGAGLPPFAAREVVIKLAVKHDDQRALDILAKEFAHPGVAMAQGLTGVLHGRPKPTPVLRVHSFLWPKHKMPAAVEFEGETHALVIGETDEPRALPRPTRPEPPVFRGATVPVPLRALAVARSGDKGDDANIGIVARQPLFYPLLTAEVTRERVAAFFAHYLKGEVERFLLPGFDGINFLLHAVLDGGGSASLRYDPQAKTYGQMLLDMTIDVPEAWLAEGGPLGAWAAQN